MNNAQRVVMQMGEGPNGAPTDPEDRPAPASRLPSWAVQGTPRHTGDGTCWCQPTYEDVPGGGRLFIHRRTIDDPKWEDIAGDQWTPRRGAS